MTDKNHNLSSQPETSQGHTGKKKKIDPVKLKHRKMNRRMAVVMCGAALTASVFLIYNLVKVTAQNVSSSSDTTSAMSSDTDRSMSNDQYTIGNNPTDYEKECFQMLTDALNSGTEEEQAEALVYAFVSDYFTWNNKDGNYDVGGQQYFYSDRFLDLLNWSRYELYEDLDLYIYQYGRENLPEVTSITTDVLEKTADFEVKTADPVVSYPCYKVQVSWEYSMGSELPPENFITSARFFVVNHNGRLEIAEFYDMDWVDAYEVDDPGTAEGTDATASAEAEG
jgi:hypothetical protein